MSLAKLTIDLTANLSAFEGDMGRAGQIATRTGDAMARAAIAAEKALAKQADQVGRTQAEYLALQAAQAGLGDSAKRFLDIIEKTGVATAAATQKTAFSLSAAAAAAETSADRQRKSNAELVTSILRINEAYQEQRRIQIAAQQSGSINEDQLKARLQALNVNRTSAIEQLKAASAQQAAQRELEAAELASVERRKAALQTLRDFVAKSNAGDAEKVAQQEAAVLAKRAAAFDQLRQSVSRASFEAAQKQIADAQSVEAAGRKVIDSQNGLTATYREQLRALRDLRDAGAISPAQFRQAGTELVNRQPVVKENTAAKQAQEDAARAEAARALALAQSNAATALVAAQSRVYTAFLIAEAAAANEAAAAEQHRAQVASAVAAATERSRSAQQAANDVKTAYIAKVNEEAAALFRTRDAQRQLDAERAGVSTQQAAQLAKRTGDREFISTIYQAIEAEERFAATFGKTAAEILKQDAATRNLSNTTASAIARFEALAVTNQKARDAAKVSQGNEAYLAGLEREIATLGKARSEIVALELAKRGLTDRGAPLVKALQDIDAKTGQLGKSAFATRNQLLTLQYTFSDVVASLGSGISPLTILLQQGGQVRDAFGSTGDIFRTLGRLITPARLAIGGLATGIGALAYAMYTGAQQSKEFNDALVLTGNYAGQTAGQFTEATRRIAASGQVSISAAREFGLALASTGQVGPAVFEKATEAAARYGAATGKNAKDVAADFASMGENVFKWASDHNKQLNLVTTAQLEHIKKLQEQGKTVEAQQIIYDALNKRLGALEPNLGTLDRAIRAVTGTWAKFWDAAFDVGRERTIEDKIATARQALQNADRPQPLIRATQFDGARASPASRAAASENAGEELRLLLRSQSATEALNAEQAKLLELNKKVADDTAVVEGFQRQAKAAAGLTRELDAMYARFKRQDELGEKDPAFKQTDAFTSAADRAAIIAKIKEQYTDKPAASAANRLRKSELDQDLKGIKDRFEAEQQALRFSQGELQALYNAGTLSLADYYDRRRTNVDTGTEKELAALKQGEARIRRELATAKFTDPAEKVATETKLNDNLAQQAKVRAESAQATKLANIDEAESFRQLQQRVTEFRASIAQLAGDEKAAADLRAQQAFENARRQQTQAGSLISDADIERHQALTIAANNLAEAQRQVSIVTARASTQEEAFVLRATQSGANLAELENGIYLIRSAQLSQLGDLRDKVQQLADVSTDPRVQQFARELSLTYQQAAENIDPAINRIREAGKGLADDLAASLVQVTLKFTSLKDLGQSVLQSLQNTVAKLIQAPIQQAFEGFVREKLNDVLGGSSGATAEASKAAATTSQTTAITGNAAATTAATPKIYLLGTAADSAAAALLRISAGAGGAGGLSGLVSGQFGLGGGGIADLNFGGAGFPLAEGTNYVPYDGFRAILHKGEEVRPAKFNPAAGGGDRRPNIQVITPPGVAYDRQETDQSGDTRIFLKQAESFMGSRLARGRGGILGGLSARGVNTSAALPKRG